MKYTLYAMRHGEAEYNRDNLVMGTIDSPLTERGSEQALSIRSQLGGLVFDEVYASPLKRAIRTAQIVSGIDNPEIDPRLIERTFGELEGKPMEELDRLRAKSPTSHAELWTHKLNVSIESDEEIYDRMKSFIDEHSKNWNDRTILLASHSGPVRALLIGLGFFTEEQMLPGTFKNGSCALIEYEDGTFKLHNIYTAEA